MVTNFHALADGCAFGVNNSYSQGGFMGSRGQCRPCLKSDYNGTQKELFHFCSNLFEVFRIEIVQNKKFHQNPSSTMTPLTLIARALFARCDNTIKLHTVGFLSNEHFAAKWNENSYINKQDDPLPPFSVVYTLQHHQLHQQPQRGGARQGMSR